MQRKSSKRLEIKTAGIDFMGSLIIILIGQNGQYCSAFKGSINDLQYDCEHCADRTRIMDGSNTDIYGSCCLFVSKASLIPGERAPGEFICDNEAPRISPEEVRTTYGLLPNQVCQKLFDLPKRKYPIIREKHIKDLPAD